ncbi:MULTISPECIES: histidine phosphatase family protein [Pseudomonas]|uniref:histidine phosphatase family protein n=1 Tax=Pseudomonas TaxID=286 RepID=UPI0009B81BE6
MNWPVDSLVGGWFDSRSTPKGIEQAGDLARFFSSLELASCTAIYASDLLRCTETAEVIASVLGLEVDLDPRGCREFLDQRVATSPC